MSTGNPPPVVVSCEHGGHRLPRGFSVPRGGPGDLPDPAWVEALESHRGWDPGALLLARGLARVLRAPLRSCLTTRLVVDVNRSEGHPALFSPWSKACSRAERRMLVRRIHRRHRRRVEESLVRASLGWSRDVVHVGVHTFTPELDGERREVEVGVLFDPAAPFEAKVARGWIRALGAALPGWRIRENEPYDGRSDGLTTTLREKRREAARDGKGTGGYAGLELEVNQAQVGRDDPDGGKARCRELARILGETLGGVLSNLAEENGTVTPPQS